MFIHVLCHALSSKKASPLRASYMEENSDDDVSEAEDSDLENYDDDEADNRDTLLRKVTIRGRRRRPTLAPDPEKNVEKPAPMFNWRETAALLSPVSFFLLSWPGWPITAIRKAVDGQLVQLN